MQVLVLAEDWMFSRDLLNTYPQEEARVEIEEEAGNQGFVVEDLAGEIVAEPVEESTASP